MKTAIIGKGALGLMYATIITRTQGEGSVFFVMDDERYERRSGEVSIINGVEHVFECKRVSEAIPVDLIIVATKSTGLKAALPLIEPLMGSETIIISVLNGITSERKIAEVYGWNRIVPAVAYAMDAARFGTALEYSKEGYLRIGAAEGNDSDAIDLAASLLDSCGIGYQVVENVVAAMWMKFMANVGVNQTCAVFGIDYKGLFGDRTSEAYRTFIGAMREVMAAAKTQGITLTEQDMNEYIDVLLSLDPKSMPSMAQDRVNKNPSEVDEFAGEIIRIAEEHGLEVPCNRFFYERMREIEAEY